jgi:putative sterol carrier protein
MPAFPAQPVAPSEFFESWLPKAFAEADIPPEQKNAEVKLGVKLEGTSGGEWVFHIEGGELRVVCEPRTDCAFTLVQTVDDWRGTLWEGKGGAFGQQASAIFKPGARPAGAAGQQAGGMTPQVLEQMRSLNGVIRMQVTGGPGGDWHVDFKLGPGEIPATPTTTVTVGFEDAEAMASGALNPMQAFMSGKIQVAGDMGLMMQMQMIQMQAAASAGAPRT